MGNLRDLIGAGLIASGIFVFWAWILPNYQASSALKDVVAEKQAEHTEKMEIVAQIKDLASQYDQHQQEIDAFKKIVPEKKNAEEVIVVLEKVMSESGFQMLGLETSEIKGAPSSGHDTVVFTVNTRGAYTSLAALLDQLEKNIRLMDVTLVEITPSGDQTEQSSNILSIRLRINAYIAKAKVETVQQQSLGDE